MKRVTIKDVAELAGVSRQTVSRAINDKGEISPATKERVMDAVEQLGYRPNRLAQGMVTQRTRTVGLVVPDITNPFFPEVARGVQDLARLNEYNVVLCNTDSGPEEEIKTLESLMAQGVDGIITFGNMEEVELQRFADKFRPLILINRSIQHPNINLLLVDNARGAQLAVDHFANQQHRHIGMLTNTTTSHSNMRRVQSFQQAIANYQLPFDERYIVEAPANLEGGYQATRQLFDIIPEITAVFTYNDLMGIGALRACRDMGKQVPDECAIIGFDDIQLAAMVTPSLSTIHVDKYNIGQTAMERLLEMLEKPDTIFPPINLNVELILRESTLN